MTQLSLDIIPRLAYSAANFIEHAGARCVFATLRAALNSEAFQIITINGSPRSGKTHCTVKIADDLTRAGLYPRLIDGAELRELLIKGSLPLDETRPVLVVDDAELCLMSLLPGHSGPFVSFIEALRVRRALVVLTMRQNLEDLPCDQHIMSRVRAGAVVALTEPSDEDLPKLLTSMARQWGIQLEARNTHFLLRRLRRGIPEFERYLERVTHLSKVIGGSFRRPLLREAI